MADPSQVVARARALLIPDWSEAVGEGERRIPAVRGPSGLLVYLADEAGDVPGFWAEDFHLLPPDATQGGVGGVDHLALALLPGQMDSFLLFWRSLFGLEPQPLLDVPDPFGPGAKPGHGQRFGDAAADLQRVPGAGDCDEPFRFDLFRGRAFTTSPCRRTTRRRPWAARPRPACRCWRSRPTITRTCRRASSWTTRPRRPSRGSACCMIGTHRASSAMLMRGAFQHRFFFEIVERRGYGGFGAVNAPIRMAAQARDLPFTGLGG